MVLMFRNISILEYFCEEIIQLDVKYILIFKLLYLVADVGISYYLIVNSIVLYDEFTLLVANDIVLNTELQVYCFKESDW